jgi:hypothetical protein
MSKFCLKGLIACFCALFLCAFAIIYYKDMHKEEVNNAYEQKLDVAPKEDNPIEYIDENYQIKEGFSTHLPLVVLEMDEEPPITALMDIEEDRFVPLEGVEPYVDGKLSIIQSEEGSNTLQDIPDTKSNIRIKRRGNSSMIYDKAQYLIKTVTTLGEDRDVDILGMGEEDEWVLNGSMADKSMLRNYLSYRLASEFMSYTPDNLYCEVVIKKGNIYTYQGVFLFGENIKQGKDRVDITKYKDDSNFNSYLVRRDRLDDDGINLETYANQLGLSKEFFGLMYPPKKKVDEDTINYVESDISRIEEIIYSKDFKVFSSYDQVIDVDSFVDYFLINEFLGNYDSGNYSTYYYKDRGGKLSMGPVWDYDGAIDNYRKEPLDVDLLAFQTKPWFTQLSKDHTFIKKLEKRYAYLRRNTFSEEHVIKMIDDITGYIGGAQEREWYRWGDIYIMDNQYNLQDYVLEDGTVIVREAKNYKDEVYRIKAALRKHGSGIATQFKIMHKSAEVTTGVINRPGVWLFLAVCIFTIPLYYIARRT